MNTICIKIHFIFVILCSQKKKIRETSAYLFVYFTYQFMAQNL